ncbi:hypothetical protein [Crenobacter intestini]|uniref:Uncharacterized protein n=1 Tax=Crenobacter intestini TaxID=2563443 RepID=A0A4T0UNJ5_9NEIS|nr:hypothetical protein [Crenobacter intestini]TIC80339.1 hypothetical protein E5K04_12615 [Crenobacter intestini]
MSRILAQTIAADLYEIDPFFLNVGCNPDEYLPEAQGIVERIAEVTDQATARALIVEVFVEWFGDDALSRVSAERYDEAARRLFNLLHSMPPVGRQS